MTIQEQVAAIQAQGLDALTPDELAELIARLVADRAALLEEITKLRRTVDAVSFLMGNAIEKASR